MLAPEGIYSVTDYLDLEVQQVNPQEAWDALKADPTTALVDVRTIAEWDYVGIPSLDSMGKEVLEVEWVGFPEMTRNDYFAEELLSQFGPEDPSTAVSG